MLPILGALPGERSAFWSSLTDLQLLTAPVLQMPSSCAAEHLLGTDSLQAESDQVYCCSVVSGLGASASEAQQQVS